MLLPYHRLDENAVGLVINIPKCCPIYAEFSDVEMDSAGRHIRVGRYKVRQTLGGGSFWVEGIYTRTVEEPGYFIVYPTYAYGTHWDEPFVYAYPDGTEFLEVAEAPEWTRHDKEAAEKAYETAKSAEDAKAAEKRRAKQAERDAKDAAKVEAKAAEQRIREEALAKRNFLVRLFCRIAGK